MSKVYRGRPAGSGVVVTVDGRPLDPRPSQALRNHSPDGFEWGYGGSGPAQLALAILLDATGDVEAAQAHYQDYKWEVVARWERDRPWFTTAADVIAWLEARTPTPAGGQA